MNLRCLFGKFPLGGLVLFLSSLSFRNTHYSIVGFRSVPSPAFVLNYPDVGKENMIVFYMLVCYDYAIICYVMICYSIYVLGLIVA